MSVNLEPEMIVILAREFPAGCETGAATSVRRIPFGWIASPSGGAQL